MPTGQTMYGSISNSSTSIASPTVLATPVTAVLADGVGRPGDADLLRSRLELDGQLARSAVVEALEHGNRVARIEVAEVAQIATERGRGRTGGWILDDAPWRERVTGMEEMRGFGITPGAPWSRPARPSAARVRRSRSRGQPASRGRGRRGRDGPCRRRRRAAGRSDRGRARPAQCRERPIEQLARQRRVWVAHAGQSRQQLAVVARRPPRWRRRRPGSRTM